MSADSQVWLLPGQGELVLPYNYSDWILCNTDQSGYYRVNYNISNWYLLTDQLFTNHSVFPTITRSQLIDDVFQLAYEKHLNYSVALRLSQYLSRERDYAPWFTAARNFDQLINLFYGTKLASDLKDYVRELYTPYYEEVLHTYSMDNSHVSKRAVLDVLYWACRWQLEVCLEFTTALFKQWHSTFLRFPPELKPAALSAGVRQFPDLFFDVFDSFTQSLVEADRQVFLKALACTQDHDNLQYLMKIGFIDSDQVMIGHNSKLTLFDHIATTPENIGILLHFLVQNYNKTSVVLGKVLMQSVWLSMGRNVRLHEDIITMQEMLRNMSEGESLSDGLRLSLLSAETIQAQSRLLAPLVTEALQLTKLPSLAGSSVIKSPLLNLIVIVVLIAILQNYFKW